MGHFPRTICWLQPHVTNLSEFPEGSTGARWFLWRINISWSVFCAFYLNISWKSPGLACQSSQLPVYKPDERWKLPGCFEVCDTYMCCFCGAIEIWFENLCFHKQFLFQMWISDFLFHLQCAIYKHYRSEGTKPLDRFHNHCALCLTHAQSLKQNITFYFPVFPIYLVQVIHPLLQKVAVEQQLLIILWLKR